MAVIEKDSAYSWLVMVAAFTAEVLAGFASYGSVSVLVYVWGDMFDITTDSTAWAAAVMGGFFFLTGPVISVIMHRIGTWRTQMIAAILLLGSSIASAFATQYWHVIISYSIIEASGIAILNMAATDIVAVYFDKHKEKVYAGVITFLSVGLSIAPSLMDYLMKTLTYKYAMLVRASVFVLAFPIAIIYRGPCSSQRELPSTSTDGKLNDGFDDDEERSEDSPDSVKGLQDKQISDIQLGDEKLENSHLDSLGKANQNADQIKLSVFKSHLHVLKSPVLILILIYFLLGSFAENTFYAFAVEFPVTVGVLSAEQAALGTTLASCSLLVGCIFIWIISRWDIDRHALAVCSLFLLGVSLIFASMSNSLATVYASYILFGLFEGCFVNNFLAWIAGEFDDFEFFTIRISYCYCMIGVGALIGPVATGYFIKATAMRYTFYFLSVFAILGSLTIVPIWIRARVRHCRGEPDHPHPNTHDIEVHGPVAIGHI